MTIDKTPDAGQKKPPRHVLLVRYGEVALKGMNKPWFERVLEGRIRKSLKDAAGAAALRIERSSGLIVISGFEEMDSLTEPVNDDILKRVSKVFGVASVSPALCLENRALSDICETAVNYMRTIVSGRIKPEKDDGAHSPAPPLTFKIYGKRSDKTYPITSPELAASVGEAVLEALEPAVKVDVKHPDVMLTVHLRPREVFIYDEKYAGYGGLPLGTNGKGLVLLSGGIDSPVAAWLMAKRGMRPEAVHFHAYPYTSKRAQEKVEELAAILASYCGDFRLHIVNLLPAQEAIAQHCSEKYMTLLTRRFMMKVAERIARREKCNMLVTGESLGQVASQTAESLAVTDAAVTMPVMRPLIALDKTDIMDLAREIGTYEKSIEPHEDCCTVFLPKHPATRPGIAEVIDAENEIPDIDKRIDALVASTDSVMIRSATLPL